MATGATDRALRRLHRLQQVAWPVAEPMAIAHGSDHPPLTFTFNPTRSRRPSRPAKVNVTDLFAEDRASHARECSSLHKIALNAPPRRSAQSKHVRRSGRRPTPDSAASPASSENQT